jgi:hypothetical protein
MYDPLFVSSGADEWRSWLKRRPLIDMMLAPFGVEQEEKTADDKILIVCFQALTSACPGQGQTDSRTTTHSKFS